MIATIAEGVFVFSRLGGLLMTLPGFGMGAVPAVARLGAAVPLTLLLLPASDGAPVPDTLSHLAAGVGSELLLGIAMGTVVSLVFGALGTAGELLATQGGMHLATMLDPLTLAQPGAIGVLATWLGTGVFLGSGLHLHCLVALGDSFHALPPGAVSHVLGVGELLVPTAGVALTTGVTLAGPITIFVFTVNLGLSILGRMAPNLQLFFAVGPSLTVVAALALFGVALPSLLAAWAWSLPDGVSAIAALVELAR